MQCSCSGSNCPCWWSYFYREMGVRKNLLSSSVARKVAAASRRGQAWAFHTAVYHGHRRGSRHSRNHSPKANRWKMEIEKVKWFFRGYETEIWTGKAANVSVFSSNEACLQAGHCGSILLVQIQAHLGNLALFNLQLVEHIICNFCNSKCIKQTSFVASEFKIADRDKC